MVAALKSGSDVLGNRFIAFPVARIEGWVDHSTRHMLVSAKGQSNPRGFRKLHHLLLELGPAGLPTDRMLDVKFWLDCINSIVQSPSAWSWSGGIDTAHLHCLTTGNSKRTRA
jgi:hypothetical protein